MSTNADFDLFRTSEDHEALREAVRAVAEDKIAPYAAAVDADARYPQEAHDALVASDFFAPHVPEEYDGVGADALATCIVIEEVARVDGGGIRGDLVLGDRADGLSQGLVVLAGPEQVEVGIRAHGGILLKGFD